MRKIISLLTVFCLILSCTAVCAADAGSAKLTVTASDTSVSVGDTFDMILRITADAPVFTYHFSGTYDQTLAELEDYQIVGAENVNYQGWNSADNGTFTFMNTIERPSEDGTVIELQFRAKKSGSFSLDFTVREAARKVTEEEAAAKDNVVFQVSLDNVSIRISADSDGGNGGNGGNGGAGGNGNGNGETSNNGNYNTGNISGTITGNTDSNDTNQLQQGGFADLEGFDWAKASIELLNASGIIMGTSTTTFEPAANIKRGDFILILSRMLELDRPFNENFSDVPTDSYYYQAIGSARAAGIAQGDGALFQPEDQITRQDIITLAYRAFLENGYIEETQDLQVLDQFNDKESISDYAQIPMASMVAKGIIVGSDGSVNPLGNATRAEAAVMCARLLNLM